MKQLLKAKYIIFSVLFIILLLVGTKYGWLVQRYTFSKTLKNPIGSTAEINGDIKRDLAHCLRACGAQDVGFASRMLVVLSGAEDGSKTLSDQMPEVRKVISDAANTYVELGDAKSAVEVYAAALRLEDQPDLEAVRDPLFLEDVYKGIDQLAVRFPRNGHVYGVLGAARLRRNPRDEKAIAAFKKCVSILPTDTVCQSGYDNAVKSFTEPYCKSEDLTPGIKFAAETSPNFSLGNDEIAELLPAAAPTPMSAPASGPPRADDLTSSGVLVRFNTKGIAKLRELASGSVTSTVTSTLKLNLDQTPVGIFTLPKEGLRESAFFPVSSKDEGRHIFEILCLKPTRNSLPKNLKI